jgi:hypothetical protein
MSAFFEWCIERPSWIGEKVELNEARHLLLLKVLPYMSWFPYDSMRKVVCIAGSVANMPQLCITAYGCIVECSLRTT